MGGGEKERERSEKRSVAVFLTSPSPFPFGADPLRLQTILLSAAEVEKTTEEERSAVASRKEQPTAAGRLFSFYPFPGEAGPPTSVPSP